MSAATPSRSTPDLPDAWCPLGSALAVVLAGIGVGSGAAFAWMSLSSGGAPRDRLLSERVPPNPST